MHRKRKLSLEPKPRELEKALRGFGLASPILDRIIENSERKALKSPPDELTRKLLAPRDGLILEVVRWFDTLVQELGIERLHSQRELLIQLHDISECSGCTTYGHQLRTMKYTRILLEELGFQELGYRKETAIIMLGALFHDIGKAAVKPETLRKEVLNAEEKGYIKTHPHRGEKILRALLGREPAMEGVITIAHCHHKFADGRGYPARAAGCYKTGKEYLIVGLADAFDAMTSYRVYREHKTIRETLEKMQRDFGLQFGRKIGDMLVNASRKDHRLSEIAKIIREGGGKPF